MPIRLLSNVIVTSYDIIGLCCGPQRKHFVDVMFASISKLRCHNLNILGVKTWGPNKPPPPLWSEKTKKKPGLNRVKEISANRKGKSVNKPIHSL